MIGAHQFESFSLKCEFTNFSFGVLSEKREKTFMSKTFLEIRRWDFKWV